MFRLRKGDLWKATALALAISAPVAFIVRTLIAASRPPAVAQRPSQRAGGSGAEQAGGRAGTARQERMFAQRPRTPTADVTRAQAAPDPFRPYLAFRPASDGGPGEASEEEARAASLLASELGGLRLTGIISGTSQPLAALSDGRRRYYPRVGETLPGGWRLVSVGARSVTLAKDGQRVELGLSVPPAGEGE